MKKKLSLLSITLIGLVGCTDPKNTLEPNKKSQSSLPGENTDIRIMQARNFVADYDSRMERAMDIIEKCSSKSPLADAKVLQDCTRTAYNATGFAYGAYACFSCVEVDPSIVSEYNEMRKRAMLPLSSEI